MKKINFILATLASIALFSCTNDDYFGDDTPVVNNSGGISFSSLSKGTTRADFVGAEAAEKLGNHFVVYGAKNKNATASSAFADTKVFDHYNVEWAKNTAWTTTSNTSDWEYVGLDKHHNASVDIADKQTIKYWDFSTAQYDFIAYSTGNKTEVFDASELAEGKLVVTPITPATAATNAYTVTGLSADDFSGFYVANMKTVVNANYKEEVSLTFRNITTKVRMALYETVPGYSVKDVYFYVSDVDAAPTTTAALYAGAKAFNEKGTFKVKYPTIGNPNSSNSDFNQAHIDFTAYDDASGSDSKKQFTPLSNLAAAEFNETPGDIYLGRTASTASYTYKGDAGNKGYKYVLPKEEGVVLNLKCDYTLVSTDGSGETIKVTGATAQVPQIYAMWKSGFAYTYIFKISKNTNGTTGPGADPGLYPITFDAVVLNDEVDGNQETITTVATPSITTYQKNTNGKDEYVAGNIYAMVQNGADLKEDIDPNGKFYSINTTDMNAQTILSETAVSDALNIGCVENPTGTFKGRNGIKLTYVTTDYVAAVPGEDGNDMKTVEKVTVPNPSTVAASTDDDIASYYTDEGCTTAATVSANVTDGKLKPGDYYRKTAAKVNASAGTYAFVYKVKDDDDTQLKLAVVPANNTPLAYYKSSDNSPLVDDYKATGTDEVYYTNNVVVADAVALTGFFHDAACTQPANKGDGVKTFYKKPSASVAVVAGTDPAHYFTNADLTIAATANGLAAGTYWKKVSTNFTAGASVPAGYYTDDTFASSAPSVAPSAATYWRKVSETVAAGTDPTGYWTTNAYNVEATATVLKAAGAGTYYHSEAEVVADGADLTSYYHDVDCKEPATEGDDNAEYFTKVTETPAAGVVLKKFYTDSDCTVQVTYGKANGTTTYYQKVNNANTTYAVKIINVE